jgi:hypothetical protein
MEMIRLSDRVERMINFSQLFMKNQGRDCGKMPPAESLPSPERLRVYALNRFGRS